jgi:hypothetical protein
LNSGLRMTPEAYAEFLRKRGAAPVPSNVSVQPLVSPVPSAAPAGISEADAKVLRAHRSTQRFQALGRKPKGEMNKTEEAYAGVLEDELRAGLILWWKFHPMNVRLANNAFYEVDFLVMAADYVLEIRETKGGRVTDKGQLKIRLCAEALPLFRMKKVTKLTKKQGGGWKVEDYSA